MTVGDNDGAWLHHWLLKEFYPKLNPSPRRIFTGYSGGMDSSVLLHAMAFLRTQCGFTLTALHVDHGLHKDSDNWRSHCAVQCKQLGVAFESARLNITPGRGESLEAIARRERYAWFSQYLEPGDVLFTAHHQNDQVETLLLQLFRGAGVAGLAGMPHVKSFSNGTHARPFLALTGDRLRGYAKHHDLSWIEDPSNSEIVQGRNFLRHEIVPLVRSRWPGVDRSISRSARHLSDALLLLKEIGEQDLKTCLAPNIAGLIYPQRPLKLDAVRKLSQTRAMNVIRAWIDHHGAPMPSKKKMSEFENQFVSSQYARSGTLEWDEYAMAAYRDHIFLVPRHRPAFSTCGIEWDLKQPLEIPDHKMRLVPVSHVGAGLEASKVNKTFIVRTRGRGDRFKMQNRDFHHDLKQLFQDHAIPPWERDLVPLIADGEQITCVCGIGVCDAWKTPPDEEGIVVKIESFIEDT